MESVSMRARLLVFALLFFVVSAGNVQAAVLQSSPVDQTFSSEGQALAENSDVSFLEYRPNRADEPAALDSWLETDEDGYRDPQVIVGTDDRVRFSPAAPMVTLLLSVYENGIENLCTGTFIGPHVVLTAAHCVYSHSEGGWAERVVVAPGKDGLDNPFGVVDASNYIIPEEWAAANPNSSGGGFYDYALVLLDEDLGNQTGWLPVGVLSDATLQDPNFQPVTIGYPGDKQIEEPGTQWFTSTQAFKAVEENYLINDLDQLEGQSGAAVMRFSDAVIVGILSHARPVNGEYENVARRITSGVLTFITDVCIELDCTFSYFTESEPPDSETPPTQPPVPSPPLPSIIPPALSTAFQNTWARTDQPVAQGQANRTWMWGPTTSGTAIYEPYAEAPGGQRVVQYFDKSRMEITHPTDDPNSIWYVTNGLLVNELMTGELQLGNDTFEQHQPAEVNVAGDADDFFGPTYATFGALRNADPLAEGSMVTQRVDRAGAVMFDPGLADENITAARYVPETNHTVTSVFWNFMNSEGLVFESGGNVYAPLFENAFYATGYPVTEAYWANVKVGGAYRNVLIQVFERRVLTYTPGNDPGWDVEAGNVGQHYYQWRYQDIVNE
jgi:V8-like Glu-specific endopeptidase